MGRGYTWNEDSLASRAATILAIWTKGPSFPNGIPEPSVAVRPTVLAINVLNNRKIIFCIYI